MQSPLPLTMSYEWLWMTLSYKLPRHKNGHVMQMLAGRIDVNSPGLTTETELPINTQVDISTWQYIKIHYITSHYNMTIDDNSLENINHANHNDDDHDQNKSEYNVDGGHVLCWSMITILYSLRTYNQQHHHTPLWSGKWVIWDSFWLAWIRSQPWKSDVWGNFHNSWQWHSFYQVTFSSLTINLHAIWKSMTPSL